MNFAVRQAASLPKSMHLCIPVLKDFANSSDLSAENTELFSPSVLLRKSEEDFGELSRAVAEPLALFSGTGAKV